MPRSLASRATLPGILAMTFLLIGTGRAAEVESKAQKITLTGRVHTQWNYTSVDSQASNVFLMRRVRSAIKLQINDWVSGMAEVDFGEGKVVVKDAYFKMEPSEYAEIILGQTKRRFDIFELTSSTQILVTERAGRIRGLTVSIRRCPDRSNPASR